VGPQPIASVGLIARSGSCGCESGTGVLCVRGRVQVGEESKLSSNTSYERGRVFAGAGGVLAVLGAILLVVTLWGGGSTPALADGEGSPAECDSDPGSVNGGVTGTDDLVTASAPSGNVVTGVCIKAGQLHTGPLANGTHFACYVVSGVGTQTVTVTRVGSGPDCQAISHIDVLFEKATPTPTPTNTPQATATPTAVAPGTAVATPTAVVAISPPQTGSGGLGAGASTTSLLGLAVLIAGAGLLSWALRLSTRR
jgi:hypothetical protein